MSSAILIPRPTHSHTHPHAHSHPRPNANSHHFHPHSQLLNRATGSSAPLHCATDGESEECDSADELNGSMECVSPESSLVPSVHYDIHRSGGLDEDSFFMNLAIEQARRCVPSQNAYSVGAVLVSSSRHLLISAGFSRELEGNTHAEECALIKYKKMWKHWSKRKRQELKGNGCAVKSKTHKHSQDELEEQPFSFSSSSSDCLAFSDKTCTASVLSASASCASLSSSPSSSHASPAPLSAPSANPSVRAVPVSASSSFSVSGCCDVLDSLSDVLSLSSPFPVPDDFVMYTTMEPCSLRLSGKRACSWRLVDAAVRRVVVGALEPAFFVTCEGIQLLRRHDVDVSIMTPALFWQKKCLEMNAHIHAQNAQQSQTTNIQQHENKEADKEER